MIINHDVIDKLTDQPKNEPQDDNSQIRSRSDAPNAQTLHDPPLRISSRRLTGKVASLPRPIRDLVNTMLDDGHSYEDIVAKLTELGHPGFLTQNISRWKLNGYEQYLRRQERADDLKLRTESTLDLLQHFGLPTPAQSPITNCQLPITNSPSPTSLHHATESLLSLQLFETLLEATQSDLPLEQKAKLLYQLGRLVAATMRERTRRDAQTLDTRKYDDERADLQAPRRKPRHRSLGQEQNESVMDTFDRLLGLKPELPSPEPDVAQVSGLPVPGAEQLPITNSSETDTNAPERLRTPTNGNSALPSAQLPITNFQLPITNSSSANPNPIGEWPQPPGAIPVINVLGCIVGWAAHPEIPHDPGLTLRDPAANKAEPILCHQKTVLWYDRNAQPRNCPTKYPIPGRPHFIPVINSEGMVIHWREWDDKWFQDLPSQNPRPILTGGFRGQIIAWIDDTERGCPQPQHV
jgi:hypothetical protein